jgi:8-oxo-dGTP diphosphatase
MEGHFGEVWPGNLEAATQVGHVRGLLPRLWALSFALPFPNQLRDNVRRLLGYSFLVGAVAIIRDDAGRFLLARHSYPLRGRDEFWGLLGGAIEKYERPEETIRREVQQELGLVIEIQRLLDIDVSAPPTLDFVFDCVIVAGTPRPSSEVVEWRYVNLDNIPEQTSVRHRHILTRAASSLMETSRLRQD